MKISSYKHATRIHVNAADVVHSFADKLRSRARVNRALDTMITHEFMDSPFEAAEPLEATRVAEVSITEPEPVAMPCYFGAVARTGEGEVTFLPPMLSVRDRSGRRTVHMHTTH